MTTDTELREAENRVRAVLDDTCPEATAADLWLLARAYLSQERPDDAEPVRKAAQRLLDAVCAIYPPEVFRDCHDDSEKARELVVARDGLSCALADTKRLHEQKDQS